MKRIVSLLLIVVLLISYMPIEEVYADSDVFDGNIEYDESLDVFLKDWGYPSSITYNGFSLDFNRELYEDKAIPVYGTYADVIKLEGSNDFATVDGGYYTNGSYIGEYRSHGYTQEGNIYQSDDYPRDSDSGRSVSEKEWIYQYWNDITTEYVSGVTYNATNASTNYSKKEELRIAIDNMVNDVLMDSTNNSAVKDHEGQGYAVADHMNVNQINSTIFNGEGKMMQENAGRLWYQMFSTEKASAKLKKEQTVEVNILDKGSYTIGADGKTTVRVKMTGIYNDSDITSDSDKVVYYHSDEIKEIQLNLTIGTTTIRYSDRVNTSVLGNSALTYTFEVEVSEADLDEGVLTATGESYTVFYSYPSDAVNDSAFATDMDGVGGGLKSLFDVKDVQLIPDPDNVGQSLPLEKSMLSYNDYSMGDIDQYEMTVENVSTGRRATFNYLSDPSSFIDDLYTYLLGESTYGAYVAVQTVSNNGASDIYTDYFSFKEDILEGIELDLSIPEDVIDIDDVDAEDNTDYSGVAYKTRTLKIDGDSVDWDTFFSGDYSFGETTQEHLAMLEISVVSADDIESISTKAILVHTSLPRTKLTATGALKENRKVTLTNDSYYLEDPFVTSKYPTSYSITYSVVEGDMSDWKMKAIDVDNIEMLFKNRGFYTATITASNTAGRSSSTDFNIGIVPDFEPNVIFNIWNNVLTRDELLEVTYEATSLDGDIVSSNNFEIYFDEDEDGVAEKLVLETTDSTLSYTPNQLGFYKIVNNLEESFGEETIPEFITDDDIRRRTVERVFYVDNLRPLVEIDLDIPENFQKVDLYIMSDENLSDSDIAELRESRVDYNNDLRLYGLDVNAEYRDLKTYISSQSIDTSVFYGETSPPSTLAFSSNGFTGTLSLYNLTNNTYEDYYTTTKTYEDCDTVKVFEGYTNCDSGCLNSCNSVNGNACDKSCCDKKYSYEEECTTRKKTIKHYFTVNQYTGYYSGVATKSVQQAFTDPFQETSDKYVVYVADSTGFNLSEYNDVLSMADFETIVIGTEALRDSITDEMLFILDDGSDMDSLMAKAIEAIGSEYPFSSQYLVEIGDNFTLSNIVYDTEGDEITNYGYQYVQEEVYDNPMGIESYARSTYSEDASAFTEYVATAFSKSGLFKIYSLLKDNTGQSSFDKNSNVSEVHVLAHRKPIADYTLDWTYDSSSLLYDTNFVDQSYDLDHQYSDPSKGIVDVKAMYKLTSSSSWIYAIPNKLAAGSYEFSYAVKDIEGAWSDPTMTYFTLSDSPPPQLISSALKTKEAEFNLNSIPATEFLEFYDIETKFPYDSHLSYRWLKDSVVLIDYKVMDIEFQVDEQTRIYEPYEFEIPKSFADGKYHVELCVIDTLNESNYVSKLFEVDIMTPINLNTNTPEMVLPGVNSFTATTSEYVDGVTLSLYKNTEFETTFDMSYKDNEWQYDYISSEIIEDGTYTAYYEAVIESTPIKTEVREDSFEKLSLMATSIIIKGSWSYWNGGYSIQGEQLSNEPHRFLSLEAIDIDVESLGEPDQIVVEMSEALESMVYTDSSGNNYIYSNLVGEEVSFPLILDSSNLENWHTSYILPLADSTKSLDNIRLKPSYYIKITLIKGESSVEYVIDDIEITGNTLDHLYLQPNN